MDPPAPVIPLPPLPPVPPAPASAEEPKEEPKEEVKRGFIEKLTNFVKEQPWSKVQLYIAGAIGIAFIIQYCVLILSVLFRKRMMEIPNSEYEDLSRKDTQMRVVNTMNLNPLGQKVPYPWLVYFSFVSSVFVALGFFILIIKMFYTKSMPGYAEFKRLQKLQERTQRLISSLEEQDGLLGEIDAEDYEGGDDAKKANQEKVTSSIQTLTDIAGTIDSAIYAANDETTPTSNASAQPGAPSAPSADSLDKEVNKIDTTATSLIRELQGKYKKAKNSEKARTKKEPGFFQKMLNKTKQKKDSEEDKKPDAETEDAKKDNVEKPENDATPDAAPDAKPDGPDTRPAPAQVQAGGDTSRVPPAGKFTPNYALLGPIVAGGFVIMITGVWSFASFITKVQEIKNMSSDKDYEKIIKENIPRNREYLAALKLFVLSYSKVNPYNWPPRIINQSFDADSDVDEVVKMIFMYRLASHYVRNIAMLETDSKSYAANAINKQASQVGAMADEIGGFLGIMATLYVTDMAPHKRFKGDKPFDDVRALSELFHCPKDRCPMGQVTFADMYRRNASEITRKLDDISLRLSNIVDSPTYQQRIATQYKIASDFLDTFTNLTVYVPTGMIIATSIYCWVYVEKKKLRNALCGASAGLALLPFIIRMFFDWK